MSPTVKGYANTKEQKSADWGREAKDFYEKYQREVKALDKASHIL